MAGDPLDGPSIFVVFAALTKATLDACSFCVECADATSLEKDKATQWQHANMKSGANGGTKFLPGKFVLVDLSVPQQQVPPQPSQPPQPPQLSQALPAPPMPQQDPPNVAGQHEQQDPPNIANNMTQAALPQQHKQHLPKDHMLRPDSGTAGGSSKRERSVCHDSGSALLSTDKATASTSTKIAVARHKRLRSAVRQAAISQAASMERRQTRWHPKPPTKLEWSQLEPAVIGADIGTTKFVAMSIDMNTGVRRLVTLDDEHSVITERIADL